MSFGRKGRPIGARQASPGVGLYAQSEAEPEAVGAQFGGSSSRHGIEDSTQYPGRHQERAHSGNPVSRLWSMVVDWPGYEPLSRQVFGPPQARNLWAAYLLWLFLGFTSVHRFYCGANEQAVRQIAWVSISLMVAAIIPPLGVLGLFLWLISVWSDFFRMPFMMREYKKMNAPHTDLLKQTPLPARRKAV